MERVNKILGESHDDGWKVKLEYFKPSSGKYYSFGEYRTKCEHFFQVFEEVKLMVDRRNLPGLTQGHSPFIVYVNSDEHPKSYPGLVNL